jgi:hypothetical protein
MGIARQLTEIRQTSSQRRMRKRVTLLALLFISFTDEILAQAKRDVDVCSVALMKYSDENRYQQEYVFERRLGTFEPVVGEEERTSRAYRIPGTKLFAVASIFFTDESIQVPEHYDSMSLQLSISRKAKHDPLNSLHTAEAETIYRIPYASRVYTPFKIRGRHKLIVMECRREAKS